MDDCWFTLLSSRISYNINCIVTSIRPCFAGLVQRLYHSGIIIPLHSFFTSYPSAPILLSYPIQHHISTCFYHRIEKSIIASLLSKFVSVHIIYCINQRNKLNTKKSNQVSKLKSTQKVPKARNSFPLQLHYFRPEEKLSGKQG